jgi:hypothetical protein
MKNLKRATRLALIAISFLFLASTQARASHFRYATVDYKPILDVNGNPTGTCRVSHSIRLAAERLWHACCRFGYQSGKFLLWRRWVSDGFADRNVF